MWNEKKSLVLSKVCVLVFMGALAAVLIAAPWLVNWLTTFSINAKAQYTTYFLLTLYAGGIFGGLLLYMLYRMLHNLEKDKLFIAKNISYLRGISWCCFAGAIISLASGIYYLPWFVVAVVAAFMGLIVRVIKNMVAEGVRLKNENDFTI